MDRQEFGAMLRQARRESDMSWKKICFAMNCTTNDILRLELAKHSFNMKKCLVLLKIIDFVLVIGNGVHNWRFGDYSQLVAWLKYERMKLSSSQMALSKITGFAQPVLSSIENGKTTMSIDVFLKLCEVFGYQVSLVKNQEQPNCQQ